MDRYSKVCRETIMLWFARGRGKGRTSNCVSGVEVRTGSNTSLFVNSFENSSFIYSSCLISFHKFRDSEIRKFKK